MGMVLEVARILVRPGTAAQFRAAAASATPIFEAATGSRSARLLRSAEVEDCFMLLVEWEQLTDHTVSFWRSEGFAQWRQLVGHFFAETPRVEHGQYDLTILSPKDYPPTDQAGTIKNEIRF
jgi:heme-degrading monooxygenase HmoA